MEKYTFCCNCNKTFNTKNNYLNPVDEYSVLCPHCGYYLVVTDNTRLFDYCNVNMTWNDFCLKGTLITSTKKYHEDSDLDDYDALNDDYDYTGSNLMGG